MGCADCAMHKGPAVRGPLRGAYSGIRFLLFCFAIQKVVKSTEIYTIFYTYLLNSWWRGTVVERRSLAGELSLSCARPAADG